MHKAVAAVVTFAALTFAGCKSNKTSTSDLNAAVSTARILSTRRIARTTSPK